MSKVSDEFLEEIFASCEFFPQMRVSVNRRTEVVIGFCCKWNLLQSRRFNSNWNDVMGNGQIGNISREMSPEMASVAPGVSNQLNEIEI
jgi:hypothetical protein